MSANQYDLSFLKWWNRHGWRLSLFMGKPEVWTHGDAKCPFKVTTGMIRRLESDRLIERIFPAEISIWEERFKPRG